MGYLDRVLADDEELVLDLHPHWKALVLPFALVPVVVGAASYAVTAMPDGAVQAPGRWAVLVLAVLVLLWWSVRPWLRWQTTHFLFTTRRVIIRTGVLARSGRDVPLTRVNDVSFEHSFVERLLGCGTLLVESAGERGQVVLRDVPRVEYVQRELYRLVEEEDARRRGEVDEVLEDH